MGWLITLAVWLVSSWYPGWSATRAFASALRDLENRAVAEEGKVLVTAVYRFKHECGLWPNDLQELVPDYLQAKDARGWLYEPWYNGQWSLMNFAGYPRTAIRYLHPGGGGTAEWQLCDEFGDKPLGVEQGVPKFEPVERKTIEKRMLETVRRRIEQNPKQIMHHKGLISRLFAQGQFKEARAACVRCLERWPDQWWPNVMLSLIELKLESVKEGEEQLLRWVRKHNECSHWFFAAHFYKTSGQKEKCLDALKKAAESPLHDLSVKWEDTFEHFGSLSGGAAAWYAALLAYREQHLDVCLSICDRYDRYVKDDHETPRPEAFNLMRAACYLNQGKLANAKTAVEAAVPEVNHGSRYDKEVARMRKAIEAGDTKYRYDPRDDEDGPDTWKLLVEYE
jgi:tetratricopeptide (TPR) repeat protein